jgi:hypothetical protein
VDLDDLSGKSVDEAQHMAGKALDIAAAKHLEFGNADVIYPLFVLSVVLAYRDAGMPNGATYHHATEWFKKRLVGMLGRPILNG